jgi:hypothetical protein
MLFNDGDESTKNIFASNDRMMWKMGMIGYCIRKVRCQIPLRETEEKLKLE